jgi:hypothetical protein
MQSVAQVVRSPQANGNLRVFRSDRAATNQNASGRPAKSAGKTRATRHRRFLERQSPDGAPTKQVVIPFTLLALSFEGSIEGSVARRGVGVPKAVAGNLSECGVMRGRSTSTRPTSDLEEVERVLASVYHT